MSKGAQVDRCRRRVAGFAAAITCLVPSLTAGVARANEGPRDSGQRFELTARLAVEHAWGSIAAGEDPFAARAGPSLDVRDDWAMRKAAILLGGLAWYLNASNRTSVLYERGRFEGDAVLTRGFAYDDDTFAAGEHAVTTLRMEVIEACYGHRLRLRERIAAWIGAGLRYTTFEAGIVTSTLNPQGEREHVGSLSPVVWVEVADAVAKSVDLVGEVRVALFGLPVALWEPADIRFAEVVGGVRWQPHARWSFTLGMEFRAIHQRYAGREADRVSFGDNRVDLRMFSPVVKIGVVGWEPG